MSSALFREGGAWAVFTVEDGRARLTAVDARHNNGVLTELLGGLEAGNQIIFYSGPGLVDGARVQRRTIEGGGGRQRGRLIAARAWAHALPPTPPKP